MTSFIILVLIGRCHTHSMMHAILSEATKHFDVLNLSMKIRARMTGSVELSIAISHSVITCFPLDLASELSKSQTRLTTICRRLRAILPGSLSYEDM
jgi:hypothetical protein